MNNQSGFTLFTVILLLLLATVASFGVHKLIINRADNSKSTFISKIMQNTANSIIDKSAIDIEKNTYQSTQYSPVILAKDTQGNPDITWANVPIDKTIGGFTVQYFIEKQCHNPNPTNITIEHDCFVADKAASGSRRIGGIVYKFYNGVYYKIIIRIRDTKTALTQYNQMLVIY